MTNHRCVQVEVTLNVPEESWTAHCERVVDTMRNLPGLEWKLWVLDPETRSAGGVYLFRTSEAAQDYVHSPILQALRGSPAVADVRVRTFDVLDELSRRTFALRESA